MVTWPHLLIGELEHRQYSGQAANHLPLPLRSMATPQRGNMDDDTWRLKV